MVAPGVIAPGDCSWDVIAPGIRGANAGLSATVEMTRFWRGPWKAAVRDDNQKARAVVLPNCRSLHCADGEDVRSVEMTQFRR